MPRDTQKTVTIPKWVWELVVEHYEDNKDDLKLKRITSPTGLLIQAVLDDLAEAKNREE